MATTYTSFAVAGAGGYGSLVVQHLAANSSISVRVLSRSETKHVPDGVKVVKVDYTSDASIEKAISGVQVVISTLGGAGSAYDIPIARAAKKQGVKLFVPSEYGGDDTQEPDGPLAFKYKTHQFLQEIELPYVLLFNGIWTDYIFVPFFGFDFPNEKVAIVGNGNSQITFTTKEDSTRFLAHALTNFSPPSLNNLILRIEGDKKSFNDAVSIYEETHAGAKIKVTYEDLSVVKKRLGPHPGIDKLLDYLKVSYAEGRGDLGREHGTSNDLWKEWNPTSLRDIISQL